MKKFSLAAIEKHIRRHHPGCPDFAVTYFSQQIAGREWRNASLGQAVGITMQTFLRHEMTEYDTLLLHGVKRSEARRRVQPHIAAMLNTWSRKHLANLTNSKNESLGGTTIHSEDERTPECDSTEAMAPEAATGESAEPTAETQRRNCVGMTFNMERDWHTKFKLTAVSRGMNMRQLLIECFAAWEREQI